MKLLNEIHKDVRKYDDRGRRSHRRVWKQVYLPAEVTHKYYYNGWNPVIERVQSDSGTTATVRYVWGKDLSGSLQGAGGVGGLLATQVGGAWYFRGRLPLPLQHEVLRLRFLASWPSNGL